MTRPVPDLTCRELVELVTDYLEGALAPAVRSRLETHLAGCAGCQLYVDQMRQTIEAVGRLDPEAVPPEAVDRLLEIFRAARRG